ncbi:MAG: ribonuclease VapC [Archaeoglobus sp.]|nr:MAG: ribonuclease VapC [Archaeoglobus sp.]
MKCAVIDTNVLMYAYLAKVDVIGELRSLGFNKFYVPVGVVEELEILRDKLSGKYSRAARFALNIVALEKLDVVDIESTGTDKALLELSMQKNCTLITNDRELRSKAKKLGIRVGYIKEMNRIYVESEL